MRGPITNNAGRECAACVNGPGLDLRRAVHSDAGLKNGAGTGIRAEGASTVVVVRRGDMVAHDSHCCTRTT